MDRLEFSSLASSQQIKCYVNIPVNIPIIDLENRILEPPSGLPLGSRLKVPSNANIKIFQFFSIIIHAVFIYRFLP